MCFTVPYKSAHALCNCTVTRHCNISVDMLGMYPMNGAVEGSKVDSSASSSASASSTYSRPSVIGVSDDLDDDKTQSTSL